MIATDNVTLEETRKLINRLDAEGWRRVEPGDISMHQLRGDVENYEFAAYATAIRHNLRSNYLCVAFEIWKRHNAWRNQPT